MKGVRQLRFSPSGHLVAVAAGRDVILLSTSSWKLLTMLKVHPPTLTISGRQSALVSHLSHSLLKKFDDFNT